MNVKSHLIKIKGNDSRETRARIDDINESNLDSNMDKLTDDTKPLLP